MKTLKESVKMISDILKEKKENPDKNFSEIVKIVNDKKTQSEEIKEDDSNSSD